MQSEISYFREDNQRRDNLGTFGLNLELGYVDNPITQSSFLGENTSFVGGLGSRSPNSSFIAPNTSHVSGHGGKIDTSFTSDTSVPRQVTPAFNKYKETKFFGDGRDFEQITVEEFSFP